MIQVQPVINPFNLTTSVIGVGQLPGNIIADCNAKVRSEARPQTVADTVEAIRIMFGPDNDRGIGQSLASNHHMAVIGTAIAMHNIKGLALQKTAQTPYF